ncbi:MAG: thiamine-phosphate kinase [Bacillota bacterium]|nr:thiamine-phosphate kinase [Bacillota bacterium]
MAGALTEFDLIARIRARAGTRDDVLLGIGDDAAILRVPPGHDLVVSTDTLNVGVHFPPDTAPSDIGWKALAVNLSDLAAMAATPAWCTLNLTMPDADRVWLDAFLDGFLALAAQHDVALVGGDTTRGPLSITMTVHGFAPHDAALRRSGARVGDEVWISGTLGDASAGLRQWRASRPIDSGLRVRLDRPTPRIELGLALRGIASACIDVSDGLLADLGHVLVASGVGATIEVAMLPTSPALQSAFDETSRIAMQLGGGDDYELCFTALPERARDVIAAAAQADVAVTRIGRIEARQGLRMRGHDGVVGDAPATGYRHFDEAHHDADRA